VKTSHVSAALLVPAFGGLFVAVGQAMQGHVDYNAICLALVAIAGLLMPPAQLVLKGVQQNPVKGEMPVLAPDPPRGPQ
jgi:hypothetical protein